MKKQSKFNAKEMRTENVQGNESSWQQMSRKKIHGFLQLEDPGTILDEVSACTGLHEDLPLTLSEISVSLTIHIYAPFQNKQTNKKHLQIEPKGHRGSSYIIASNAFMPMRSPHYPPFTIKETEAQKEQVTCPKS